MRPHVLSIRSLILSAAIAFSIVPAIAQQQKTDPTNPFVTGPTATPATAPALTKESKQEILDALSDVVTKRAFVPGVDLNKWPEYLEKQREAIDKADSDAAFARAVNAAMRDLGISHIRFSNPRSAEARVRTSTVGVGLSARAEGTGLNVTSVFPSSPADTAGIKTGEIITLIDGKKPESVEVLQGDEGTEITVTVKSTDGKEREVKIKRARYSTLRENTLTWVGDDAAVLKLYSFTRGYERDQIAGLVSEASKKAKYLILDLRSNGGGAVNNLQHLLSLLMPEDTVIGTFISRQTADQYAEAHGGQAATDPAVIAKEAKNRYSTRRLPTAPFTGKIAVLINRGSASASEICACALREKRDAVIVGANSAGAVLASVYRKLPNGYEVQYPVSDYVSQGGVRLEKNPIKPDIEISGPAEEGKDPAVEKALERMRSAASN